jgi:hypothetical protein
VVVLWLLRKVSYQNIFFLNSSLPNILVKSHAIPYPNAVKITTKINEKPRLTGSSPNIRRSEKSINTISLSFADRVFQNNGRSSNSFIISARSMALNIPVKLKNQVPIEYFADIQTEIRHAKKRTNRTSKYLKRVCLGCIYNPHIAIV